MEKEKDLGAFWIKNGPKGEYMTGYIELNGERINLVCFTNQNKKEVKHPDWRILKQKIREEVQELNALPQRDDELDDSSIPF